MFPLTRPYRQAAATVAVLALSVAPTVFVALTAWRISRPGHRHEVEVEIGRALGLQVTLDSVRYPRPGEVDYRGVVLRQEEPRGKGLVEVGRIDRVWLRRSGRELTLETEGLRLVGESPRLVMAQVGALLQRSGDAPFERVSLTASTCALDLGAGIAPYQLREVVADFHADPDTPTARASYRVVADGSSTRCELTFARERKTDPLRTTLVLKTMEGLPLPARVLDPFFDSAAWLGSEAKVEGGLTLRQDGAREWEAEFQGHLLDINLAEVVGRRFPNQKLTGKARLAVDKARWGDRPGQGFGWLEARGDLTSGPGVIGLGLIQALATEMQFRRGPRIGRIASTGRVDLDFTALAFRFAMTPDGQIKVNGGLGDEYDDNAVIVSAGSPLAFAPEGAANVRGLIKTLFPVADVDTGVMVPLTEKSRLLLCLPVGPDVARKSIGGN